MSYLGILQDIRICKISPSKYNLREADNVEELAESIKYYGLLQPIVIRPVSPSYEVVAGNRRLAAAKLLKLRKLSCHVIELSDKEAYEVGLVENLQHKTMNVHGVHFHPESIASEHGHKILNNFLDAAKVKHG